jgi:DNA-binding transcriptional ArsR family regulator
MADRSPGLPAPEDALKAISSPVRVQILRELRERATAGELAARLDRSLSEVTHHLQMLVQYDCVEQVGLRRRRGSPQRVYRATIGAVVVVHEDEITTSVVALHGRRWGVDYI